MTNIDTDRLVDQLDFGSSTAEKDTLLQTARIETSVFHDVINDRVDLILGTKGSGKTALFKILTNYLRDDFYKERIILLNGAEEPAGDPIFLGFKPRFDQLSLIEFQNFWRVYLVALVYNDVFCNPRFKTDFHEVQKEIRLLETVCIQNNFPFGKKPWTLKHLVNQTLQAILTRKITTTYDTDGTMGVSVEPGDGGTPSGTISETPIFINEIRQQVLAILRKAKLKVWILIDRLDEIFPRRTPTETIALKSLLLTTNSFPDESLRLKIFLRDDIFSSLIDPKTGFTALTHVTDRASDTLKWDPDLICKLIVKRIFCYESFREHFHVDKQRLEKDRQYQVTCFYHVFPQKAERGMSTLDWIYSRCQDGLGVVTPRDVIDLLQAARNRQVTLAKEAPHTIQNVISFSALRYGYERMSERKVNTFLQAEFPHLWEDYLSKFQNQKSTLMLPALARLLGTSDSRTLKILEDIGFLRAVPNKRSYTVPYLYRHGMRMVQGTVAK